MTTTAASVGVADPVRPRSTSRPATDRRRWRKRAVRCAALLLGCALAALAAEALVVLVHGPTVRFPRRVVEAPWGLRYNQPGARYRHASADVDVSFRINGQGMRADRDVSAAKAPGWSRIVCLGDSFTVGYEVEEPETFARVMERALREQGRLVEVLNCGVSGFSTAEELLYLERELWRYEPDVVVLSFYANDLEDNVRTGLFALRDGRLEPTAERYVPLGRLGTYLNASPLFGFLSERSNAVAFLKERATLGLKARMLEARAADGSRATEEYRRELEAALLERLSGWCRERGVRLVIQSIPDVDWRSGELLDAFPYVRFSADRPGVHLLRAREFLAPWQGRQLLYWTRSHGHWTPFAHDLAGRELARLVLDRGLLD